MSLLANRALTGFAIVVVYLALQPGWDYLREWTRHWRGRPGDWVAALRASRYGGPLEALAEVIYLLGIPYAALLLGVIDIRRMGLVGFAWRVDLAIGALIGVTGAALLSWSWRRVSAASYRRSSRRRVFFGEWQAFRTPWGWVPLLAQVICLQFSWGFVRAMAIALLGLYWGVFVALALTGVAWFLRPGRATSLANPDSRARELLLAGLATVSAMVFLYSQNLWLCAAIHAIALLAATLAAGRAYADAVA